MRVFVVAAVAGLVACGSSSTALRKAGEPGDEGDGILGKLSMSMVTADVPDDEEGGDTYAGRNYGYDRYGYQDQTASTDDPAEPAAFGGEAYGGSGYASFYVRPWSVSAPDRTPNYTQQQYLKGAIEGTVRWTGATPAVLTTACGPVTPLRVSADRGVAGVIVYIESVEKGRQMIGEDERTLNVGGTVAKRGCSLVPAAQVLAPMPSAITIYGDAKPERIRVSPNTGEPRVFSLEPASRAGVTVDSAGLSRVDTEDGSIGAAFVLGLSTTYYAITDDRGHFRIDELAPGTYTVTVWQAPLPKLESGKLVYGKPTTLTRKISVSGTKPARLDVSVGK